MSKKTKMVRVRHSSLEMPADPESVVKKKDDILTKTCNKILNLSEALKSNRAIDGDHHKKTMAQATLDYLFKHYPNREKNHVITNNGAASNQTSIIGKRSKLKKQNSVGSYPIKIEITEDCGDDQHEDDINTINRSRPATICVDKLSEAGGGSREAAALALERPRKKLSFREPEILGCHSKNNTNNISNNNKKILVVSDVYQKNSSQNNHCNNNDNNNNCGVILHRSHSFDNNDLESQAMRVVRTIGQAFEVCHKLSITAPENDNVDQDEQDTLTQDLISDRLSDNISDKPKKELMPEGASDKTSLPPDDSSLKDCYSDNNKYMRSPSLDILLPPPNTNTRKTPLIAAESYASPHSDLLTTSGSGMASSNSLTQAGGALSAHHELQLMREQLDQQSQQTQAAMAQLQLVREQLAAEQSARLEAQARTHQLLIHNRELLDHIAALVAHLQGGEKSGQQPTPPHVMPQQQSPPHPGLRDTNYTTTDFAPETVSLENHSPVLQQHLSLNPQGLIENRAVTSCLPSSPLRTTFNPAGSVFNFPYSGAAAAPPPPAPLDPFDPQLLQRLQNMTGGYSPAYNYNNYQSIPAYLPPSGLYNQAALLNNSYTLQQTPQKKLPPPSPLAMRHSFTGGGNSPATERRLSPGRNSEPRQLQQPNVQQLFQSQQNLSQTNQQPYNNNIGVVNTTNTTQQQQAHINNNNTNQQQHLQVVQHPQRQTSSPRPMHGSPHQEGQFIKPLSQMGTLTTTDTDGRVRVIVPIPPSGSGNSNQDDGEIFSPNMRLNDDRRTLNGPAITRSTSEKVPNRSELMSQVQRTMWARHTTK